MRSSELVLLAISVGLLGACQSSSSSRPGRDGGRGAAADGASTDVLVDRNNTPVSDVPVPDGTVYDVAADAPSPADTATRLDASSDTTRDAPLGTTADTRFDGDSPLGGNEAGARDGASDSPAKTNDGSTAPMIVTGSPRLCDRSGWCWLSPLPTGNELMAVLARGDSDVWIAARGGSALHWNGSAWTQFNVSASSLRALTAEPSGAVWVAGGDGLAARYDGTAFTITPTGTTVILYGIAAVGDDQVYAVGEDGVVLFWDGKVWTSITDRLRVPVPDSAATKPESRNLTAVWGVSPDDVWIGADYVVWHKVGDAWSLIVTGLETVTAIAGTSTSNVWFRGDVGGLHWDGAKLEYNADVRSSGGGNGLWVGGESDVWSSGNRLVSHWDGKTWTQQNLPSYTSGSVMLFLNGLSGTANDLWGVGSNGAIVRWDGKSWSWLPDSPGQNAVTRMPGGAQVLWASRADDIWLAYDKRLFHYDGNTVVEITEWPGKRRNYAFWGATPDDLWAFGSDGIAHWDGKTWTLADPVSLGSASGLSASDIWAVSGPKAYHWDGKSWTAKSTGLENAHAQTVFAASPTMVWTGGQYDELMRWDGTRWAKDTSVPRGGSSEGIRLIWGSGPTDVWAFSEQVVYHYDGTTWKPDANAKSPWSGWGSGPRDFWGAEGDVFHFDGATWTDLPVSGTSVEDISGFAPGEVFLATRQGLLRWGGK